MIDFSYLDTLIMADIGAVIESQLVQAAKVVEEQLDAEMKKLENLDEDGLEEIKAKRVQVRQSDRLQQQQRVTIVYLQAMKRMQEKRAVWRQNGHGEYQEIPEEKEFFNVTKNSENVVCHFYRDETFRCKVLDKHLGKRSS